MTTRDISLTGEHRTAKKTAGRIPTEDKGNVIAIEGHHGTEVEETGR